MASTASAPTGPDTIINLKVTQDGAIKKLKLPLRDMGASTLESKLRYLLDIKPDEPCVFERYSDSAASFVVLNPTNTAVFKQLYRAAKAKQKLKLRVTTVPAAKPAEVQEPRPSPRPVTVEDVPEVAEAKPSVVHVENAAAPVPSWEPSPRPAYVPPPTTLSSPVAPQVPATASRESPAPSFHSAAELEKIVSSLAAAYEPPVLFSRVPRPVPAPAPAPAPATPEPAKPVSEEQQPSQPALHRAPFAVYCNSCDKTIPNAHYHCSTCDDGDFDLCQACVEMGISCYGDDHWLIKRTVVDGSIVTSTTERKAPKSLSKALAQPPTSPARQPEAPQPTFTRVVPVYRNYLYQNVRTCNNCVQEFPEKDFLHCTSCFDFDLCMSCFLKDMHGHHPSHGFISAVEGTVLDKGISSRLAPGRNYKHNAICDGCDKFISGVRHKCLDCPDWDYCADCVVNAGFVHPTHRFVPIYEALRDVSTRSASRPTHFGIHCDGPLCRTGNPRFITGERFKCTICHDTDFCANCESSPANSHNKTHPLLKFKTPVRGVNVVTTGEHEDGKRMPVMGDRARCPRFSSRATETAAPPQTIATSSVQTVVDVQPVVAAAAAKAVHSEPAAVEKAAIEKEAAPKTPVDELLAVYECDTVADGTVLPANHIFEQTWILRNAGTKPWPAGCSVKFVGGDYMGHVDSNHPAGVKELVSAFESTICYQPLAPGQTFPFTVLLRTPPRDGKIISYWRLTTPKGEKFGHRLWCDVEVKMPAKPVKPVADLVKEVQPAAVAPAKEEIKEEEVKDDDASSAQTHESQMIFPKLEKESPVASVASVQDEVVNAELNAPAAAALDFVECDEDGDWDESEDGFMTDEEYDILDASDEEDLVDEQKKQSKK